MTEIIVYCCEYCKKAASGCFNRRDPCDMGDKECKDCGAGSECCREVRKIVDDYIFHKYCPECYKLINHEHNRFVRVVCIEREQEPEPDRSPLNDGPDAKNPDGLKCPGGRSDFGDIYCPGDSNRGKIK